MVETGVLYCGDNLEVMPRFVETESIDLIYIDPPFFSSRYYEVLFGDMQERRAFEDRWKGELYHYVNWLSARIAKMREMLKPTGTMYVHLDWHAVHYVKVELDRIFGRSNFQNEIVWYYRGAGLSKKRYARRHDNILFYSKGSAFFFNPDPIRQPYADATKERFAHHIGNVREGRDYGVQRLNPLGKHPDDVWVDVQPIAPSARARLGYPTQKPEQLLERILLASSKPDDIVADFFCGCGTTMAVAQRLGRRWIGCDVSPTALRVVRDRLQKLGAIEIKMVNYPMSEDELRALKPFEFQNYVISYIQGVHSPRLSGDFGIDGYTLFNRFPVQVKQQNRVGRPEVQKFESAIRRERKDKGYIFALGFTRPAYDEAARIKSEAGVEIVLWRIQDLITSDPAADVL